MKKHIHAYILVLLSMVYISCQQSQKGKVIVVNSQNKGSISEYGPKVITRNIIQDKEGNIWMAAFDGIFKYNGKFFCNITEKVSSDQFFSILEDSGGNFWFGSVHSGVYHYNGKSFRQFTTSDGLLDNGTGSIYEDSKGNIWLGAGAGVSRYDGKSFKNYILDGTSMSEYISDKKLPKRPLYGINSIMEDKKGILWFGADGVFRYDGKSFKAFMHNGEPFKNVRAIIEDKKGNVWIGGADGLWCYDGRATTNFSKRFTGYILEDRQGNIWTSSGTNSYQGWTLSRYDVSSLESQNPTATTIANKQMTFGILEDKKGNIWFGDFDGVHRYDGKKITDFKNMER